MTAIHTSPPGGSGLDDHGIVRPTDQKEIVPHLDSDPPVLRHTNCPPDVARRRYGLIGEALVVNLLAVAHTHIASADAHLLPKSTAYLSDLDIVGSPHSVIGVDRELA